MRYSNMMSMFRAQMSSMLPPPPARAPEQKEEKKAAAAAAPALPPPQAVEQPVGRGRGRRRRAEGAIVAAPQLIQPAETGETKVRERKEKKTAPGAEPLESTDEDEDGDEEEGEKEESYAPERFLRLKRKGLTGRERLREIIRGDKPIREPKKKKKKTGDKEEEETGVKPMEVAPEEPKQPPVFRPRKGEKKEKPLFPPRDDPMETGDTEPLEPVPQQPPPPQPFPDPGAPPPSRNYTEELYRKVPRVLMRFAELVASYTGKNVTALVRLSDYVLHADQAQETGADRAPDPARDTSLTGTGYDMYMKEVLVGQLNSVLYQIKEIGSDAAKKLTVNEVIGRHPASDKAAMWVAARIMLVDGLSTRVWARENTHRRLDFMQKEAALYFQTYKEPPAYDPWSI